MEPQSVLASLAMAAVLSAQPAMQPSPTLPTPAQMVAQRVAHLTALLTLTSTQQTQATTLFTTEENALTTIRTSLAAVRTALETAVEADDLAIIATDANQIGALATQQVTTQATADAAFFALLTVEQQTKYKQLRQVGLGFGGLDGFGAGPGHPGGH